MQESFLHYIWKHQYFDKSDLFTSSGDAINVITPGLLNIDSGPDFKESKIKIDDLLWVGNVELHVKSSDWLKHGHQDDEVYNHVILHVVWEEDTPIYRKDGNPVPTLELKGRIADKLITKHHILANNLQYKIACEPMAEQINDIYKYSMIDSVVVQRLWSKWLNIKNIYDATQGNWEETCYRLLVRSFGLKVNANNFLRLAELLPFSLIKKYQSNLIKLEALLFGVAGFLQSNKKDDYYLKLQSEYQFLAHKHGIEYHMDESEWQFLRMRPPSFPTVRIAQLAAVFHQSPIIFENLTNTENTKNLFNWLQSVPSAYWRNHYHFNKKASRNINGMGLTTCYLIVINTIGPLLFAYGKIIDNTIYTDKAIHLLTAIPFENNHVTRAFNKMRFSTNNAYDSQGIIHLFNEFCYKRKCLQCHIGASLLKPE